MKDGIGIEFASEFDNFDTLYDRATELTERLVDAHAFFAKFALLLSWSNWVEAKGVVSKDNVIGWVDPALRNRPHVSGHPDNLPFRQACELLAPMEENPALRIALRDFRAALRQPGADAVFYAFRAVEDVRWHFQKKDSDKGREAAWKAMHPALGTTESDLKNLTTDSTAIRHGKPGPPLADRETHIATARDVIKRLLVYLKALPAQTAAEAKIERVRAAFGSRPDLPPGEEYVERMKDLWAGLLKKRDE